MENEELEKLRELYIKSLDYLVSNQNTLWIDPNILASNTGTTISDITNVVFNFDDFVENSKGKISTRINYEKKTPFLRKVIDASTGSIE